VSYLHLQNLTVAYQKNIVLKKISCEIPDKKITVIMGPSGCGKTTLLKTLNRLIDLNEDARVQGNVSVDGEKIYSPKTDVLSLRKKIGFLSQRPCPLPMSIYENVAFGPKIHRLTENEIFDQIEKIHRHSFPAEIFIKSQKETLKKNEEMDFLVEYYLRLAGLWEEVATRLHEPASKLSVGQQQRLALARTLAVGPEVILADEPTSALDPVSTILIEKQFELLKSAFTIVVVTHILRQARRIADYILFLYSGGLIEYGPAKKILDSPTDKRTLAYISGEIS